MGRRKYTNASEIQKTRREYWEKINRRKKRAEEIAKEKPELIKHIRELGKTLAKKYALSEKKKKTKKV